METSGSVKNDFLNQVEEVIRKNISNETFGVSELAGELGMSRSNLLRKVKKLTKLSVSQLIRQVRLKHALELLRSSSLNVSEVSYQVGFSSTSYFIKCFREYYGYSPGTVGKRDESEVNTVLRVQSRKRRNLIVVAITGAAAIVIAAAIIFLRTKGAASAPLEKSIVVLPFKNDSNDSDNVYLINGLMEATLNNLQKIRDLRVISRTSAEKYRSTSRSIPEMAEELNVSYFVEGSGQKIGDRILLNIQLIEGTSDRHLWSRQYEREVKDIFKLQQEIAENIAKEIEAVITPEEETRIKKNPTDDIVAYDYFLKGRDLFYQGERADLEAALPWFKKAIEQDNEFALAYAEAAMVYYYLDIFQVEKKYGDELGAYADKALLYDPKLANSLVAKGLFYLHQKKYDQAVPYLEKALEYNPNSWLVINFLSEVYNNFIPNTGKYLEYALKGLQLEIADSVTASYKYLHLSNALIQNGFIEEALRYIDQSLAYSPENKFSRWVRAFVLFARDRDFDRTLNLLIDELKQDTTQLHLVEEIGKVYFLKREYDSAYLYYKRFLEVRETMQLDLFKHENMRIAITLEKMGLQEESEALMEKFKEYAEGDHSIYRHLNLAEYYGWNGDTQKAFEHLRLFAKEDNFQFWVLLWDLDTGFDPIKDRPEFKQVMKDVETRFWDNHKKIRVKLEGQGLL